MMCCDVMWYDNVMWFLYVQVFCLKPNLALFFFSRFPKQADVIFDQLLVGNKRVTVFNGARISVPMFVVWNRFTWLHLPHFQVHHSFTPKQAALSRKSLSNIFYFCRIHPNPRKKHIQCWGLPQCSWTPCCDWAAFRLGHPPAQS